MKIFKTAILFTILTGLTLFATGCPEHRSIAEIERNPGRYQNKQVIITGRVVDSYGVSVPGLGGGGAYKVDDGTGSIWVLATDRGVPAKGSEVGVQGESDTECILVDLEHLPTAVGVRVSGPPRIAIVKNGQARPKSIRFEVGIMLMREPQGGIA